MVLTHWGEMSVVRSADGGASAPSPRTGIVQATDRAEKMPSTRLRVKPKLKLDLFMAVIFGAFIFAV